MSSADGVTAEWRICKIWKKAAVLYSW